MNAAGGISVGLSSTGYEDRGLVYEESIAATWNLRRSKDWGEIKGVFAPMEDNRRKVTIRSKTECVSFTLNDVRLLCLASRFPAHAELSSISKMRPSSPTLSTSRTSSASVCLLEGTITPCLHAVTLLYRRKKSKYERRPFELARGHHGKPF